MSERQNKKKIFNIDDEDCEECQWCDTTGDVEKNRGIYWTTVLLIVLLIVLLYILAG